MREAGNVNTWKLRVQTRPGRKDLPAQRINIDVCAIPSYQPRPMMLLNPYGVDMGTSGLILQAQSREEIFADTLVAFALRPNRLKNRDLWDIAWLHQQQVTPALALIADKLRDHHATTLQYLEAFAARTGSLRGDPAIAGAFRDEMRRFLPNPVVRQTVQSADFWSFLSELMEIWLQRVTHTLGDPGPGVRFRM